MYLTRQIESKILESLVPNKVIIILGARRTGKTVLLKQISNKLTEPYLFLNAEDISVQEILSRRTVQNYKYLLGDNKILIIDEAQKIDEIGLILKLMIDEIQGLKILVTGSSPFDIQNKLGEPLIGRKKTFHLFPIAEKELLNKYIISDTKDILYQRLITGCYPELLNIESKTSKADYLREIVNSYLMKDILSFENIRNSKKLFDLLRLVAYQIGSELSYNELATQLSISKNTVEKYLDLCSKTFIIYRINGFSKNLRKEVTKSSKWYFYDNGIRNAIIADFNLIENRNDKGKLWENYILSERIKHQFYHNIIVNNYFWRTYDKQEIDLIEERDGKLYAYEFKWKETKVKIPVSWESSYPNSEFNIITTDNYLEWI